MLLLLVLVLVLVSMVLVVVVAFITSGGWLKMKPEPTTLLLICRTSMVKRLRQATNEYPLPPLANFSSTIPASLVCAGRGARKSALESPKYCKSKIYILYTFLVCE